METLTIEREAVIRTPKDTLLAALSDLFVNDSDRRDFQKLSIRVEATIRVWYFRQFSSLIQDYGWFDPHFDPSSVEGSKLSEAELEVLEERFIDKLFKVLLKGNYSMLSQKEFDTATEGKYLLNLPIKVDKKQLDSTLLRKHFERQPPEDGELPQFAHQFVVFRRGVGIHQTSDLFINEKLDVIVARIFNSFLRLIGLRRRSREEKIAAVGRALKKTKSLAAHSTAGDLMTARDEERERLLQEQEASSKSRMQVTRIRLENLPLGLGSLFKKTTIQEPTFERIIVLYRPAEPAGNRHIVLKQFHDIPMADMEIVFPAKKSPGLTPMDWLKMIITAVGGLAAIIGVWDLTKLDFAVLSAIGGAIASYLSRVYFTFLANQARYHTLITDSVYSKQLDSGRGTLLHIFHEVVQQEVKEVLIAYYILMTEGKATKDQLDERCEDLLADEFKEILDFDISDACTKLQQLGVITKEESSGCFVPVSLKKANEIIGVTTEELVANVIQE